MEREVETDEYRYYLRRILPYRTTDHHLGGVVITFVDLTQRKRLEAMQRETDARHFAELHESAERLQTILDTAADAIVTIDRSGKIDSVNLATQKLFDFKRQELVGENICLLMPSLLRNESNEQQIESVENELAGIIGNPRELLARRRDGSVFPVDLSLSRVDHLGLYTGILRDITIRKQLQTHILEIASDEQSRIGQELHDGTQQELTGLSLYAGSINEILRHATPFNESDSEEWRFKEKDYQRLMQTVAKLSKGLTEANLHVHKLSHGIMPVQIDAEGLRSALAELASSTNEQQNIRCSFDFSGSGAIANKSIATQLYRIAQESLNNALKHSKANNIQISLSQQARRIVLEVSDNGIGFESDAKPSVPAAEGGLGLRIMEYRASILGGDLKIKKNGSQGTTVRCTVPTIGDSR